MKCSLKLMAPISVNTVATVSIGTLSKKPMLSSCVDRPPVASVEKLWLTASKTLIPASQYATAQTAVSKM